jgi:hypothetical protein
VSFVLDEKDQSALDKFLRRNENMKICSSTRQIPVIGGIPKKKILAKICATGAAGCESGHDWVYKLLFDPDTMDGSHSSSGTT